MTQEIDDIRKRLDEDQHNIDWGAPSSATWLGLLVRSMADRRKLLELLQGYKDKYDLVAEICEDDDDKVKTKET